MFVEIGEAQPEMSRTATLNEAPKIRLGRNTAVVSRDPSRCDLLGKFWEHPEAAKAANKARGGSPRAQSRFARVPL